MAALCGCYARKQDWVSGIKGAEMVNSNNVPHQEFMDIFQKIGDCLNY